MKAKETDALSDVASSTGVVSSDGDSSNDAEGREIQKRIRKQTSGNNDAEGKFKDQMINLKRTWELFAKFASMMGPNHVVVHLVVTALPIVSSFYPYFFYFILITGEMVITFISYLMKI